MNTKPNNVDPTGSDIALAIAKALNLPPNITRLSLTFTPDKPPVVDCEFWPLENIGAIEPILPEFASYELVRRDPQVAELPNTVKAD